MLNQPPLLGNSSHESSQDLSQLPPEINLIPFIDVLLVILIFLMISTTFTKYQQLSITLPSAEGVENAQIPKDINIAISKEGQYAVNGFITSQEQLGKKLLELKTGKGDTGDNIRVIISADAMAPHQAVMFALENASAAELSNIAFATQSKTKSAK
ncbi:MAG: biopolymer transporter ExbD [Betaproteobacteria bacterium]|jgi:biopolymer transport protein ExbD